VEHNLLRREGKVREWGRKWKEMGMKGGRKRGKGLEGKGEGREWGRKWE
jgi:hypothetical protein